MEKDATKAKAPKPLRIVCPKCKGAQFIRSARCRMCKGSGKIEAEQAA
jgi:DnaJ-class molecular chaperone